MDKKSGRRYDRECKENAVALVRSGRSATEVARHLGVSTWSLNRWVALTRGDNGPIPGDARPLHPPLRPCHERCPGHASSFSCGA